jgi:hypothetical protein
MAKAKSRFSETTYQAALRVGRKPIEKLIWLLELAQKRNLETANLGELIDEIGIFVSAEGGRPIDEPAPDLLKVDHLIAQVRGGLSSMKECVPWTLSRPKLSFSIAKDGRPLVTGDLASVFTWSAWHLVGQNHEALGQCAHCGDWFAATRPFQKYCSSKCGQAVHNETYQKNTPAEHRSGLRRRSYLKVKARSETAKE